MQLQIKNLQNDTFSIECERTDSIKELKEKIAARDNLRERYDATLLKLLYKGKVMDDDDSLESYEVAEDGYLLLVKQTPGKPPVEKNKGKPTFNGAFGMFNPNNPLSSSLEAFNSTTSAFAQTFLQNNLSLKEPFQHNSLLQQTFQSGSLAHQPFRQSGLLEPSLQQHTPMQSSFASFPSGNLSVGASFGGSAASFGGSGASFGGSAASFGGSGASFGGSGASFGGSGASFGGSGTTFGGAGAKFSSTATDQERQEAINTVIAMGFEREQAEKALRASYYDVPAAIEFLTSGNIPEQDGATALSISSGLESHGTFGASGNNFSGNNAQLQHTIQMLKNNPEQLKQMKHHFHGQPDIVKMIDENPQQFIHILEQSSLPNSMSGNISSGFGSQHGSGTQIQVSLTPEEQKKIDRLQDMGFDRNRAIEAYLTCDRNEEIAVNYLLYSTHE